MNNVEDKKAKIVDKFNKKIILNDDTNKAKYVETK